MSITKVYSVFCDDGSSVGCHGWAAESMDGAKAARSEARAAGWKVRGGDVCPACQTQKAEEDAAEAMQRAS